MKFVIVLLSVVAVTMAQRPTYAGTGPKGRPGLANRFRDDDATDVPLVNRIGEDGSTPKIPVDARGDVDLVNRLNEWPREHRPFWLINAEQIEQARNPQGAKGVLPSRQPNRNELVNRNSFRSDSDFNQNGGINFESRSSFDQFDPSVESKTIKPLPIRSSFLGPLRR